MSITTRNQKGSPLSWNEMDANFEELKLLQTHNHDQTYASLSHNHDQDYAELMHNHDGRYAGINHSHSEFPNFITALMLSECFDKLTLDINNGA